MYLVIIAVIRDKIAREDYVNESNSESECEEAPIVAKKRYSNYLFNSLNLTSWDVVNELLK
jgi:hypothetical protein